MRKLLPLILSAGLALAATATNAAEPGRDITCRGPINFPIEGLGGYGLDLRTVGEPETRLCYLEGNPEASVIVDAA
jgi:hypothetical protein